MKTSLLVALTVAVVTATLAAQEPKPVPKGSLRVAIPGCSSGSIFTTAPRREDRPSSVDMPPGTHLRMNGPKTLIADIKAHEGTMIELTGLVKEGQARPAGVGAGPVRIGPGGPPSAGSGGMASPFANQVMIDVEGWRAIAGDCPGR